MSMMYLKLSGVEFSNATQAGEAAAQLMEFRPSVSCYRRRGPSGETQVVWTVKVPAGLRPDGLIKHLQRVHPHTEWVLLSIDEDGFEVDLQPGKRVCAP